MKTVISLVASAWLAAATGAAAAATLYSNGPVVGANGLSVVTAPASTLSWGIQSAFGNRVADDFVVPVGSAWTVSDIDLFAYQTGAASFTFQTVAWSVIAGIDINTGTTVASGSTTPTNGGLLGYRVTASNAGDTSRGIYDLKTDITDVTLQAGTYWLAWTATTPDQFSGPWQPTTSDLRLGNVKQASGGAFFTPLDPNSQLTYAAPFQLNGLVTAVPEAPTLATSLAGLVVLAALRRRQLRKL